VPAVQGRLALKFARQLKPDLILLDLDLPDMHGSEVLVQLQYDPATRDLPVVIISADEKKGQRNRLLADGAFAFLKKPLDVREFIETLDRALAESAPIVS
jgi:CheY-like chemotaxis protein